MRDSTPLSMYLTSKSWLSMAENGANVKLVRCVWFGLQREGLQAFARGFSFLRLLDLAAGACVNVPGLRLLEAVFSGYSRVCLARRIIST